MLFLSIILTMSFAMALIAACLVFKPRHAASLSDARHQIDEPVPPALAPAKTALVYVAGCCGLKAMRRTPGASCWWKVGVVRGDRNDLNDALSRRLEALGQCSYGGWVRRAGKFVEEPGFRLWHLQRLARPENASPREDVTLLTHAIAVRLPLHLSFAQFDARLRGCLEPVSWRTAMGVRHRGSASRYSSRDDGFALATELFTLRPRYGTDVQRLLDAIIAILDCAH